MHSAPLVTSLPGLARPATPPRATRRPGLDPGLRRAADANDASLGCTHALALCAPPGIALGAGVRPQKDARP